MYGGAVTSYDSSPKKAGNFSGRIEKLTTGELYVHSNTWIPISNTVATDYIFSGWVYSDNPSVQLFLVGKKLNETEYNTVAYSVQTTIKNQWVYLEQRVTIDPNIITINLRLDNNGGGNVWFDDVSIRKVNPAGVSEIIEANSYYPFGLEHKFNSAVTSSNLGQKIKYNGKELQDELGLNVYDYGARNYDAALGRWFNVDPLAETSRRWSPYTYAYNNPMRYVDPDGMMAVDSLKIDGADADLAVKELNDESQLNLTRNSTTGMVTMANQGSVDYTKLSTQDKALYDIIDCTSETVNISTTQDVTRADASGNLAPFFLGSFNGATSTSSQNEVNMLQAVGLETGGGQSAGTTVRHEIFEGSSAMAAINNPNLSLGATSGPAFVPAAFRQSVYNSAHPTAAGMDSNYSLSNVKGNQVYINSATAPMEMWFNLSPTANSNTATGWFKIQN